MAYFIARNIAKGGYTMKFVARNAVERTHNKICCAQWHEGGR